MGATLLAAEAAADAAVAWHRKGEVRRANAVTPAGRRPHRPVCDGAVTPALRAIRVPARLTRSEHNSRCWPAGGRSNREIADEIRLSVRTIETHLGHVHEKLGISAVPDLPRSSVTSSVAVSAHLRTSSTDALPAPSHLERHPEPRTDRRMPCDAQDDLALP